MSELNFAMIGIAWLFLSIVVIFTLLFAYLTVEGWRNTLIIRRSDLTVCRKQRDYYREKLDEAQKRVNELQERIDFLTRGEVRL